MPSIAGRAAAQRPRGCIRRVGAAVLTLMSHFINASQCMYYTLPRARLPEPFDQLCVFDRPLAHKPARCCFAP